jgi:hypothetical protein
LHFHTFGFDVDNQHFSGCSLRQFNLQVNTFDALRPVVLWSCCTVVSANAFVYVWVVGILLLTFLDFRLRVHRKSWVEFFRFNWFILLLFNLIFLLRFLLWAFKLFI